MEVLNLHCPSCGAIVDIPDGLDTFYCSHCGTKLMVSGQDKNTLDAKVRLRIAEKKLDLEYKDKELERLHKAEQDKRDSRELLLIFVFLFISLGVILLLMKSGFFSLRNMLKMWFG